MKMIGTFAKRANSLKSAILLVGPTGSGKTPLGDFLEKYGLAGRRCVHFDFGSNMRRIGKKTKRPFFLSMPEFLTVRNVLKTGSLLKEKEYSIAGKILSEFVRRKRILPGDLLILNGLPRHIAQAEALDFFLKVIMVVNLRCRAGVVLSRIIHNSGGDRAGRVDDSLLLVKKKLRIYRSRTLPLLDHYRRKRVKVVNVVVTVETSPKDIVNIIRPMKAG